MCEIEGTLVPQCVMTFVAASLVEPPDITPDDAFLAALTQWCADNSELGPHFPREIMEIPQSWVRDDEQTWSDDQIRAVSTFVDYLIARAHTYEHVCGECDDYTYYVIRTLLGAVHHAIIQPRVAFCKISQNCEIENVQYWKREIEHCLVILIYLGILCEHTLLCEQDSRSNDDTRSVRYKSPVTTPSTSEVCIYALLRALLLMCITSESTTVWNSLISIGDFNLFYRATQRCMNSRYTDAQCTQCAETLTLRCFLVSLSSALHWYSVDINSVIAVPSNSDAYRILANGYTYDLSLEERTTNDGSIIANCVCDVQRYITESFLSGEMQRTRCAIRLALMQAGVPIICDAYWIKPCNGSATSPGVLHVCFSGSSEMVTSIPKDIYVDGMSVEVMRALPYSVNKCQGTPSAWFERPTPIISPHIIRNHDTYRLNEIVRQCADDLFAAHPFLSCVVPAEFRLRGDGKIVEPCIALYVRRKGYMHETESMLPKKLGCIIDGRYESYGTDVREGEFSTGITQANCPERYHNRGPLVPGSLIAPDRWLASTLTAITVSGKRLSGTENYNMVMCGTALTRCKWHNEPCHGDIRIFQSDVLVAKNPIDAPTGVVVLPPITTQSTTTHKTTVNAAAVQLNRETLIGGTADVAPGVLIDDSDGALFDHAATIRSNLPRQLREHGICTCISAFTEPHPVYIGEKGMDDQPDRLVCGTYMGYVAAVRILPPQYERKQIDQQDTVGKSRIWRGQRVFYLDTVFSHRLACNGIGSAVYSYTNRRDPIGMFVGSVYSSPDCILAVFTPWDAIKTALDV